MVEADPPTGHVHIRAVEDGDLESFFEDQLDPEATRMAAFLSRDRTAFMAHWAKIRTDQSCHSRAIVVDGQVAGNIGSWDQPGHREVGYWIGRAYWGRGIATRALALYLADESLRPLHAYVAVHNAGSIRVLEKCGFHPAAAGDIPPSTANGDDVEHLVFVLKS
ncbi:MAG: GNAT family N-acetyltransferase [Dermatophilaceae bacterium]